jgi:D-alanyl-lipoteichoic acid acyltransferase DltB (MBOAT superfamily)
MLFNSFQFAVFFPVVTVLYFLTKRRWRWLLLLVASCVFYMALIPIYILILALLILVDYCAGILIEKSEGARRRCILIASLTANLGILFFFKYFNFFDVNVAAIARMVHWNYSISTFAMVLPVGLSFHTFQSMSYTIEIYRRRVRPERHLGIYSLYVLFYPQLVAGPIERPQHLLPQLRAPHSFDWDRVKSGLGLMFIGFIKKMVIADQLSVLVNTVYDKPQDFTGTPLILATYAFAFQIYCDFSGYTDIARGAARVMGFDLVLNFDKPYLAENIADFWRRWHISLSSWFRDYVYYPLGGNRAGFRRQCLNLMIVFSLSGLWHGANWNFVIWGALHGTLVIGWHLLKRLKASVVPKVSFSHPFYRFVSILVTFHLVTFAWIFFRAKTFTDALHVVTHLFKGVSLKEIHEWVPGYPPSEVILSGILVLCLVVAQGLDTRWSLRQRISRQPLLVRAGVYTFLFVVWSFFVITGDVASQRFIYFQF